MNILDQVTPTNIEAEKEKFLSDTNYNPQFTYATPTSQAELLQWGIPSIELFEHSLRFIKKLGVKEFHEKVRLSQTEVEQHTKKVLESLHFKDFPVLFSTDAMSQAVVTKSGITFRLPITMNLEQLAGKIRHEVESHMLRTLNHSKQPWASYVEPEAVLRLTEEGVANLHSYVFRTNKVLIKSYVDYVAAYQAMIGSFRQTYDALRTLGVSENLAWIITLRKKRGLLDTSQPGLMSKDITYLEGLLHVAKWLQSNDAKDLYLGKIASGTIPRLKPAATAECVYPSFFANMSAYMDEVQQVLIVNKLDRFAR